MTRTIIITHPAGRETVFVEDEDVVLADYVADRYPEGATWRELDAAAQLAALKAELKAAIDDAAERERLKYVTAGAGQAMEYQQAAAEAERLLAAVAADPDHEPDPADYPMLAASIGIDGDDLIEVATTVAGMHGQWQMIGAAIRAARLAAKTAIDAAADEAAARAVKAVWPVPPQD